MIWLDSFAPLELGGYFWNLTHSLRCGLHSFAASRLREFIRAVDILLPRNDVTTVGMFLAQHDKVERMALTETA